MLLSIKDASRCGVLARMERSLEQSSFFINSDTITNAAIKFLRLKTLVSRVEEEFTILSEEIMMLKETVELTLTLTPVLPKIETQEYVTNRFIDAEEKEKEEEDTSREDGADADIENDENKHKAGVVSDHAPAHVVLLDMMQVGVVFLFFSCFFRLSMLSLIFIICFRPCSECHFTQDQTRHCCCSNRRKI